MWWTYTQVSRKIFHRLSANGKVFLLVTCGCKFDRERKAENGHFDVTDKKEKKITLLLKTESFYTKSGKLL